MLEFMNGKWTAFISLGGSVMAFFFGAWNLPLQLLLGAIFADYICGMMKAFYHGDVSSRVGYKGLMKKVGILFMVMVGQFIDMMTGLGVIRNAICLAYAVNELVSITENVSSMDIYVPPFIKDNLAQIKTTVEKVTTSAGKLEEKKEDKAE